MEILDNRLLLSYISVKTEITEYNARRPKMTTLVLGGAGFIGRHVAAALAKRGHSVVIGSRHPARTRRGNLRARAPSRAGGARGGVRARRDPPGPRLGPWPTRGYAQRLSHFQAGGRARDRHLRLQLQHPAALPAPRPRGLLRRV